MRWNGYEISANVSMLFTELPYQQRFRAAAEAGFSTVETWWPFAEANPGTTRLDEFLGLLAEARLRLTGVNFFAGDMPAGERGIACRLDRRAEWEEAIEALLHIARATGCRAFNLLYGQPDPAQSQTAQRAAAVAAYRSAAEAVAELGGTVLVEPLAEGLNGTYPLTTHHDVFQLIEEVGSNRLALLLDTFHLGHNGVDVAAAIGESAGRFAHVQLADVPGRGEPGTGGLDWPGIAAALKNSDYRGTVAAEYKPTRETTETLSWLTR